MFHFVAPATGAKVVPSALDRHSYETVPSKVGVTLVRGAGTSPSHIVCAVPIEPAVRLLTVTFIEGVGSVHVLPFNVEVTWRLYHESAMRAPAAYVSLVAPVMFEKVDPSRLLCH